MVALLGFGITVKDFDDLTKYIERAFSEGDVHDQSAIIRATEIVKEHIKLRNTRNSPMRNHKFYWMTDLPKDPKNISIQTRHAFKDAKIASLTKEKEDLEREVDRLKKQQKKSSSINSSAYVSNKDFDFTDLYDAMLRGEQRPVLKDIVRKIRTSDNACESLIYNRSPPPYYPIKLREINDPEFDWPEGWKLASDIKKQRTGNCEGWVGLLGQELFGLSHPSGFFKNNKAEDVPFEKIVALRKLHRKTM
jgi:hypothetical protein